MLFKRPPGPQTALKLGLLMAIAEGCQVITYRRAGRRYEMAWLVSGMTYPGSDENPGYVRKFAPILGEYSHGRAGLVGRFARFFRRLGSLSERGVFDLPVGPEYVAGVSYRVDWRRGHVTELVIELGGCAALSASGIAKVEYELEWYGPLDA